MRADRQKLELILARKCMTSSDIIGTQLNKRTWYKVLNGKEVRPRTIGILSKALGVDVTEIIASDEGQ